MKTSTYDPAQWVLVPREPDTLMVMAAEECEAVRENGDKIAPLYMLLDTGPSRWIIRQALRAAIAAAPPHSEPAQVDERGEFENFITSPPFEKSAERYPDHHTAPWPGAYRDIAVTLAWEAWQAARGGVRAVDRVALVDDADMQASYKVQP